MFSHDTMTQFVFSFSNLFSGTDRPSDAMSPYVNIKYSGSEEQVSPGVRTSRDARDSNSSPGRQGRGGELFDGDSL